jgi:hypothetical protein
MAFEAVRARQHHGFHARPRKPVPDFRGLRPVTTMALGLLLMRAALSQMDVPTRSSYVMAVVAKSERPAAASFTSVPPSLAGSLSPALAGALFSLPWQAYPLISGALKIAYDLLLLNQFRHLKPPKER